MIDFVQNDLGYEALEAIPGLTTAIVVFALSTLDPRKVLNEAADLLDFVEGE